jgi:ABC-type phosphate transport system auxiliary subunit
MRFDKFTDVDYLKKELNRIADEVKKFDVNAHLTPQAQAKIRGLEKSYTELVKRWEKLQTQLDTEVVKFLTVLKKTRQETEARIRAVGFGKKATATTTKKAATSKKAAKKKTTKKAAVAGPRASKKTSSKKATV